jgi:cathepsin D
MSPQFAAGIFNADGLMGLAFDKLSALNAINFFSTIIDQERIDEPVFGFRLTEKGSALVLGGRDSSLYTGSLTYVAVDNPVRTITRCPLCLCLTRDIIQAFWQTAFDGITVNGNDVTVGNKQAIIDTGTTLVLGDLDSITNFYKNIPGSEASESGAYWTSTFVTVLFVMSSKANPRMAAK